EVALVLAPTLASLRLARVPPSSGLGLTPVGPRAIAGALLVAVGGFYLVAGGLEPALERIALPPAGLRDQLHRLLLPPGGPRPLAADLLALAIVPAVCEEALFRGALLRALAPVSRRAAVVATALAFGFFH